MTKLTGILAGIILLGYLHISYAADISSVTFFASNNTDIINPQHAYERLLDEAQDQLKNTMINIMQSNHMEQSKCEDSIGMYQMENDGNMTADNTKIFTTSPYQIISDIRAFEIAKEMANSLKQESVALFIPNEQENVGDTIIYLKSHQYHIDETLKLINEKLPHEYSKAFSLHFNNKIGGFENTTVSSIEWLGNKIDPNVIQNAFPKEGMASKHGKAFLVFKNGQKEEI